ncbi:cobalamin biosynthesis protein [Laceyella sacchari]|uniref:GTPase, G3E family n=1 Tax=Laceyella tengchongensis TaxID=574699 RepID=A0AA45WJE5_9BACL|nr:GTP-binding protein [Laceyella tengchongensis]AUS08146.1 cobalamin biosynthesis protein [Laceyella sacchari]SMP03165.1 GTPase, G3E family [Laceyella tengchongensis]
MTTKPVEIYILSGFLGSGKTTLLTQLLAWEKERGRQVAVLMNEIGNISVDSRLLPPDTPLKELLNGCICCTIQAQLSHQLLSLCQQHTPDAIYIEATGAAHPIEVLDACITPLMAKQIKTCKIVTTLDLPRWRDRDRLSVRVRRLMEEQVRFTDFLIINKASDVAESERERLIADLVHINSTAPQIVTDFARFDLPLLYDAVGTHTSFYRTETHQPAHAAEHLRVRAFSYTWDKPIDRNMFEAWLRTTPDTLYRAKGYLRFHDQPQQTMLFQYAYGMPMFTEEPFPYPSTVVFIGEDLPEAELKAQLAKL